MTNSLSMADLAKAMEARNSNTAERASFQGGPNGMTEINLASAQMDMKIKPAAGLNI
jgi:hypothetical protein